MFNQYSDILNIDELCEALLIGRNQAYRLLNQRAIKGFRIGKTWKIPKSALMEYICKSSGIHTSNPFQ